MIEENLFIFLKRNWRLWQNSLIIVVEFLLLNWQKIVTVWFRWIHKFKKHMNINFYGYDFEIYTLCFFNILLRMFEVCIHKIIFWEVLYFFKNYIVWPVFFACTSDGRVGLWHSGIRIFDCMGRLPEYWVPVPSLF